MNKILAFVCFGIIFTSCSSSKISKEKNEKRNAELIADFNKDTLRSKEIAGLMKMQDGETVCDIGGGFGFSSAKLASYFPGVFFYEEDVDKKSCNKRRFQETFALLNPSASTNNYSFYTGTDTHIPFSDKSFKYVTVFFSVHEFSKKNKMMDEIRRIMSDDGLLYLRESVYTNTPAIDSNCKFSYLSEKELYNLIKENGFDFEQDSTLLNDSIANDNLITVFLECYKKKN